MANATPTVYPVVPQGAPGEPHSTTETGAGVISHPGVEPLYTSAEVVQILKIKRTKLFELVKTGELRSLKIGASRRFPASALREFIASRLAEAS